jgi:hypothetical protein
MLSTVKIGPSTKNGIPEQEIRQIRGLQEPKITEKYKKASKNKPRQYLLGFQCRIHNVDRKCRIADQTARRQIE